MLSPVAPPSVTSLETFYRNFCAQAIEISPDAQSLHRTAMRQPGVYFTLDAPFVKIIGLYSNALEDPGVISSEEGLHPNGEKYPAVPEYQLAFLHAQLQRIKDENYDGCVLLAVHHPPFSYAAPADPNRPGTSPGLHGGSPLMLRQIDEICHETGVYLHAFLSGHAHNYQRYTRTVRLNGSGYDVPFIICGSGGHAVNTIVNGRTPRPPFRSRVDHMEPGLILEKYNDLNYGYLRITVDSQNLRIAFHNAQSESLHQSEFDAVTVALGSHSMIAN